ncbi:hypothetical protein SAMN04488028_101656 [Reichenbachiella agariperforans]|uniref:Outer membrane protein beta-barrel domain-containing protein n=2 Tax=Reichenbachiellaceae TaxID=2762302 RepID=A0A1M6KPH3_REIAG|nr:hypothetical protein SAMN04488028_101656 [Reichenbachiella agariperforans]
MTLTGLLMMTGTLYAQNMRSRYDYQTAVGVRGIGTSGLTIKHFTKRSTAIEGIIGFYPNAFSATVLYERYASAFDVRGLNWYYGVGGHIATQSDVVDNEGIYRRESSEFGLGVDGIFGIEYKIQNVPIAVSLDFKPFVEVATDGDAFMALDPGLGIKVAF